MAEDIKTIAVAKGADVVETIIYAIVGVAVFTAIVGGTLINLVALI